MNSVTKRPILNIVVALLMLATVLSLCIPAWAFTIVDMEKMYLNADGSITVKNLGGVAMVDDAGAIYGTITSVNGKKTKIDETHLIYTDKVPVGDDVGESNFDVVGKVLTANGKGITLNTETGLLTYVDGTTFTTTVTAPPAKDPVTGKASAPAKITDDLYVNTYGEIVTAKKKYVQIPVIREKSTSVMAYIAMPHHRSNRLVTEIFESVYDGYILNGQVWMPILLFILGIVSAFVLLFVKRNTTSGLIMPILVSVFGIIVVWTNQLTRGAGLVNTLLPSILMLGAIAIGIYNGNWFDVEGDWRKDPSAAGKIKEIKVAASKKNLELLKSYVQSSDPAVRIAALDGIARVGGFNAFHPIVGQLSSSNADVRIAAAEALVVLGDPRGRTYLLYYMEEDPSPEVREAMNIALSKMPSVGA